MLGPYEVDTLFKNGTIKLITIDEEHTPFFANGHRLQLYHHSTSRGYFMKQVSSSPQLEMLQEEGRPPHLHLHDHTKIKKIKNK